MWLVTGATGQIGNVLVRKLIERGEKVRALVLPNECRAPIQGLEFETVEVLRSNPNISHTRATREPGYRPRPLYDSIQDAVKWFLDNRN